MRVSHTPLTPTEPTAGSSLTEAARLGRLLPLLPWETCFLIAAVVRSYPPPKYAEIPGGTIFHRHALSMPLRSRRILDPNLLVRWLPLHPGGRLERSLVLPPLIVDLSAVYAV